MTNSGSGIKFSKGLRKLDYADLLHVRLLISYEHQTNDNDANREKYSIIENKSVIEI
jgi:hypothetical protein